MYYVYVDETADQIPFYVGKGISNRIKRLTRNRKHTRVAKKYGQNRIVLIETEDEAEAFEYEKAFIAELHTYVYDSAAEHLACNFTTGGDGAAGKKYSPTTRKKISMAQKGVPEKYPVWNKGKRLSIEHCQSLSIAHTGLPGHPQSQETRKKISNSRIGKYSGENSAWFGKQHSPESIQKIRESNTGKIRSAETRQRISKSKLGIPRKPFTAETKAKMSAAAKLRGITSETRAKMLDSRRST